MKLLNCLECHDIQSLRVGEPVTCECGQSTGHYLEDGRTATYGGPGRLLGILNHEYLRAQTHRDYKWFVIPEASEWVRKEG